MTAPLLEVLNLESAYGPVKAVRGVSLSVREGRVATGCRAASKAISPGNPWR